LWVKGCGFWLLRCGWLSVCASCLRWLMTVPPIALAPVPRQSGYEVPAELLPLLPVELNHHVPVSALALIQPVLVLHSVKNSQMLGPLRVASKTAARRRCTTCLSDLLQPCWVSAAPSQRNTCILEKKCWHRSKPMQGTATVVALTDASRRRA
jgi:hypothetical protein